MKVINLVVDKVIKAVMAVSGIVLLAVTFWQVVCRYVLKAPLPWSQDIIRLSFTYLVFWGAAYCVHEKANLNVDVLLTSLPKVIGKLLEIIINVVLARIFRIPVIYGTSVRTDRYDPDNVLSADSDVLVLYEHSQRGGLHDFLHDWKSGGTGKGIYSVEKGGEIGWH